ncbi:MAG: DUF4198 domain-containing protein [Sphingomicrobium sp.]|nr:DUF4198 domain-containing protein [Sphingomonadales bacterium]
MTTFGASSAAAHDIWLTAGKINSNYVAQVHFGDLTGREIADPRKIVSLEVVTPTGSTDLRDPLIASELKRKPVLKTRPFSAPAGSVLAVSYDNGFWMQLGKDKHEINTSKLMVPDGTSPHWTVKYSKLLLGRGSFNHTLGMRLEIIALKDPYALPSGAKMPVRLLLSGKPYGGADIVYTDGLKPLPDEQQPKVKTNKDGIAEVPYTGKGPVLLTTDINVEPLHPPLAAVDHLFASLSFDTSK